MTQHDTTRRGRFQPNDIMSLTEETPDFDLAESVGPDLILSELTSLQDASSGDALKLQYGTTQGDLDLRQAIATANGVSAEDVVITIGGMHALFLAAFCTCEPGDEVITTTPLFPNTRSTLESVRARIRTIRLTFDAGYKLTPEDVSSEMTPTTRMISLATPQNPSGVAISPETLQQIAEQMTRISPQSYLIVDETYREAVYGQNTPAPSAASLHPRIVSIASLSKCHGAPGLRIGWAITQDQALREQLILGKFNTVISNSTLDEAMALRVFDQIDAIFAARKQRLQDGFERTENWVANRRQFVDWIAPDAGALCCIRLRPELFDKATTARFYKSLESKGVRVAPGSWFGEDNRVFRLGFGLLPITELDAGLARMTEALEDASRAAA
ncbi:MAG: pyridoxal phosphate-dependent aminotransferase [Pseudomonadota bacterium]